MTLDLKKEKKAAEDHLQSILLAGKAQKRVDIGATQEVKTSQTQQTATTQTKPVLSPREKLQAYLKSIGQQ